MQIKEAKIFNFGKLQNINFEFSDGINVIYGENEKGKTTLHAFLTGMLFGMEKGRGRTSGADVYTRYEPWHAPSFYSGALRFEVDGKPFYLERNFYHKGKREYLRNEADGEELSVTYGDLDILLGGIGREEYGNTYDIPQSGAATGKEMSQMLTAYLAEAEAGGDGRISVLRAQKELLARKKELSTELRGLSREREEIIEQKQIEYDILCENVSALKKQIERFEEEQQTLLAVQQEEADKHTSLRKRRRISFVSGVVLLVFALVLGVLLGLQYFGIISMGIHSMRYVMAIDTVLTMLAIVMLGMGMWPVAQSGNEKELISHARSMLTQMKEHLQESENQLINIEDEIEEAKAVTQKERTMQEDIMALELAVQQIGLTSQEYYLEVSDELNAEISKWISLLTKGAYDSARLDKDGKLWILAEHKEVLPESLSRGTLEQIYLALRLAAGSIFMREEEMPIFLDEAFAMYDDERLSETLKALAQTGKQILIFTCQKREAEILQKAGIRYHQVRMPS